MSDAFKTWRKAQNPLRIGGPLDDLLEKAFLAGMQAQIDWTLTAIGQPIETRVVILEEPEEKIERIVWLSFDKGANGSSETEYYIRRPAKLEERGSVLYNNEWILKQLYEVPPAMYDLGNTLKPGELKRAVLIGGVWSLREADGA